MRSIAIHDHCKLRRGQRGARFNTASRRIERDAPIMDIDSYRAR
jgi:hypothetical protein